MAALMKESHEASHVRNARMWLEQMGREMRMEVPIRLHEGRIKGGLGFSPPFTKDFDKYIGFLPCQVPGCRLCRDKNAQRIYMEGDGYREQEKDKDVPYTRATRALRKLRKASPTEFDAVYLALMHGLSLEQIAERMTTRAIERDKPERYEVPDVAVLVLLGADKMMRWY